MPASCDAYYFAPQKCFGSEGGLWLALLSPAAIERVEPALGRAAGSCPPSWTSRSPSRTPASQQTYNTPALATLFLLAEQVDWFLAQRRPRVGRLALGPVGRDRLRLGRARPATPQPFVAEPAERSHVTATIDLDDRVDALEVAAMLRANGVVDTEPYRKLGRNQLRIALFPGDRPRRRRGPDGLRRLGRGADSAASRLQA